MRIVAADELIKIFNQEVKWRIKKTKEVTSLDLDFFAIKILSAHFEKITSKGGLKYIHLKDVVTSYVLTEDSLQPHKELFRITTDVTVALGSEYTHQHLKENMEDIMLGIMDDAEKYVLNYYRCKNPTYQSDDDYDFEAYKILHLLMHIGNDLDLGANPTQIFHGLRHDIYSRNFIGERSVNALRIVELFASPYLKFYEDQEGILLIFSNDSRKDIWRWDGIFLNKDGDNYTPCFSGTMTKKMIDRYKLSRQLTA